MSQVQTFGSQTPAPSSLLMFSLSRCLRGGTAVWWARAKGPFPRRTVAASLPSNRPLPSEGGKGHMVDARDSAWRNRAPGPHAHRNTARQATDGLWTEARGRHKQSNLSATTSTSPIRQLLGAADAQTAHPATFSTAPTHQILGSANAETTPARAPAAAADRTQ